MRSKRELEPGSTSALSLSTSPSKLFADASLRPFTLSQVPPSGCGPQELQYGPGDAAPTATGRQPPCAPRQAQARDRSERVYLSRCLNPSIRITLLIHFSFVSAFSVVVDDDEEAILTQATIAGGLVDELKKAEAMTSAAWVQKQKAVSPFFAFLLDEVSID